MGASTDTDVNGPSGSESDIGARIKTREASKDLLVWRRLLDIRPQFSVDEGEVLEEKENEIWARSGDVVGRLADKICVYLSDSPSVDVACIGAGAINQAIKAISVARYTLNENSLDLVIIPFFSTIIDDKERERTRMILRVTSFPASSMDIELQEANV